MDLDGKVALVLGNEARGLGDALTGLLDEVVTIPMAGATESLNVATAAAVLGFALAHRPRPGTARPYDVRT